MLVHSVNSEKLPGILAFSMGVRIHPEYGKQGNIEIYI